MVSKIGSNAAAQAAAAAQQLAKPSENKPDAAQTRSASDVRSQSFEGLGGAERAEMQRFMSFKPAANNAAQAGVRNLGAATALLFNEPAEASLADRTKEQFASFDLTDYSALDGKAVKERDPNVMRNLPDNVQESYEHYFNNAEANDWGSVTISKHQVGGEDVYMVSTTTDGDDNYMELFAKDGAKLASGQSYADDTRVWDAEFGACRAGVIWD
ncbi:MAG: hypothetical protein OSB21_13345 [Myxococcota bacterium]|nr:hypothetical protein [Myxococcota bacterium]